MEYPFVGRAPRILTLPGRLVQAPDQGTRLGADADDSWARRVIGERLFGRSGGVCSGDRRASFREEMEFPPNIATDAQPGYSAVAYQSADILFGSREGDCSILVRIEDTCTPAHAGPKSEMARRARVGYWPRCTNATHIAVPLRYEDGESPKKKDHGLQSRREHGPWPVATRNRMDYDFEGCCGMSRLRGICPLQKIFPIYPPHTAKGSGNSEYPQAKMSLNEVIPHLTKHRRAVVGNSLQKPRANSTTLTDKWRKGPLHEPAARPYARNHARGGQRDMSRETIEGTQRRSSWPNPSSPPFPAYQGLRRLKRGIQVYFSSGGRGNSNFSFPTLVPCTFSSWAIAVFVNSLRANPSWCERGFWRFWDFRHYGAPGFSLWICEYFAGFWCISGFTLGPTDISRVAPWI